MFVGRTAEVALLRAELRAAGGGRARRVVVEGPEGIGKSALVHHTLGGEAGVRVLEASGEDSERQLRLGVLRQLAVEAAGPAETRQDPFAAGQALCDLIDGMQADGPLVVLVDDAQWADRPSLIALGYVLRRVRTGRVLMLFACRDLADPWLPDGLRRLLTGDDTLRIPLDGLTAADLAALATPTPSPDPARWFDAGRSSDSIRSSGLLPSPDSVRWFDADRSSGLIRSSGLLPSTDPVRWIDAARSPDPTRSSDAARYSDPTRSPDPARLTDATRPPDRTQSSDQVRLSDGAGPSDRPSGVCDPEQLADQVSERAAGVSEPGRIGGRGPGVPEPGRIAERAAGVPGSGRVGDWVAGVSEPGGGGGRGAGVPEPGRIAERAAGSAGVGWGAGRAVGAAGVGRCGEWGAGGLSEVAAVRLCAHTLGNPLHARALLAAVPARVLDDPGTRLPAPATYLRPFMRRLGACGSAARQLVAACAVLGGNCPLHVAAAVATGVDEPLNALEEAVAAGVLRELPGRLIDFPEPLARAAAYDSLGAGARARLHLAASLLADDTGTALRHRAAAAGGPDEALAEELVGFAAKAAQHGQWQEAAAHLGLAAGLTESPARRDELRTAVLEHVLIGGDVVRAAELAAARNADPRPVRRYVLGRLALAAGRFEEASELLAEAWRHREPGFTADVAEQLAWLHLVTGDRAAAVSWARLAIEQPIEGAVARPYDVLALGGAPDAGAPPDSLAAAVGHLAADEAERAGAVLRRVVAMAAVPHHRLLATALLAAAEHRAARWDGAAARAEHACAQAAELGQRWLLPCLEAACVAPLAALGEHERARAHLAAARDAARELGHALGAHQADLAAALLGDEGAPARDWDAFVPDPRPGRIEALVADGRLEEAGKTLAAFDESGAARRTGPRGQAERIRLDGLLLAARNVPKRAEESFCRALALVESGECPLEEARVLLDLGRLLRRTGRRKAAAERLAAARAIFERLEARPLVDRCAHELEACGLEPPATVRLGLTPQELSIAMLVAGGLTNRQIARELLISVKTVEYHLGKIYTKLGIGSRVALAAKLAAFGKTS
ncbi:LuxR family transcriptional regulator [Nonomuraea sp. NPDC046802]|uniref:helix-turn-helix transcriptional regulator n=1 Tax=Nonomuraea sp. NPDC046802 TaxID=3154919 RepID=UPI0033C58A0A